MTRKPATERLTAARLDEASAVLARAFRDDPVQRFVIPDDKKRARLMPWTFRAVVRYCLPYGEVRATPDLGGVACWMPPGSAATDAWGVSAAGWPSRLSRWDRRRSAGSWAS